MRFRTWPVAALGLGGLLLLVVGEVVGTGLVRVVATAMLPFVLEHGWSKGGGSRGIAAYDCLVGLKVDFDLVGVSHSGYVGGLRAGNDLFSASFSVRAGGRGKSPF